MEEYKIQVKVHKDSKWVNIVQTQSIFYDGDRYVPWYVSIFEARKAYTKCKLRPKRLVRYTEDSIAKGVVLEQDDA